MSPQDRDRASDPGRRHGGVLAGALERPPGAGVTSLDDYDEDGPVVSEDDNAELAARMTQAMNR